MINWILYQIPAWVWGLLALAFISGLWFFWKNLKGVVIVAAGLFVAIFANRLRQAGYEDKSKEMEKKAHELDKEYNDIEGRPDKSRDDVYDSLLKRAKNKR